MPTLVELINVPPEKWKPRPPKEKAAGGRATQRTARARRWVRREWWHRAPAAAVTTGGLAAVAAWAINPGGFVDLGRRLASTAVTALPPEVAERWAITPPGSYRPLLDNPREAATVGGVALAGAVWLNHVWPRVSETEWGQWWAWWADRRLQARIRESFKQRWVAAMAHLGVTAPLVELGCDEMGNIRVKAQLAFSDGPSSAGKSRVKLEDRRYDLAGMLPVDGLGWPEGIEILDVDSDRTAFVEVLLRYEQLPPPTMIPADLDPAPVNERGHDCIRLGLGHDGWVMWDIDEDAHLNVIGPSGFGKGVSMAAFLAQWLQRGWLALIVDGGGAPEHEVQWGPLIGTGVNFSRYRPSKEIASLLTWEAQLREVIVYGEMISDLCTEHGVTKWVDLKPELKEQYPRIGVFCDELTLALRKGTPKTVPDDIRKRLATQLSELRRGYRKYGVHVIMLDQVTHASRTHLGSSGALEQASMFMYVGPATRPVYRQMASGTAEWPSYVSGRGRGVAGKTGEPGTIQEIVRPMVTVEHLQPVVAEMARRWAPLKVA